MGTPNRERHRKASYSRYGSDVLGPQRRLNQRAEGGTEPSGVGCHNKIWLGWGGTQKTGEEGGISIRRKNTEGVRKKKNRDDLTKSKRWRVNWRRASLLVNMPARQEAKSIAGKMKLFVGGGLEMTPVKGQDVWNRRSKSHNVEILSRRPKRGAKKNQGQRGRKNQPVAQYLLHTSKTRGGGGEGTFSHRTRIKVIQSRSGEKTKKGGKERGGPKSGRKGRGHLLDLVYWAS